MKKRNVLDFKRNGFPEPIMKAGYLDTTEGIEVTRKDALDILRVLEADRRVETQRKERDRDFRRAGERAEQGKQRLFAARVQYAKMKDRAKRHNMDFVLPRSFKERRHAIRLKLLRAKIACRN